MSSGEVIEKIKEFDTKRSLSEIYQKVGLRFSFLSKKNEQCHPWIKCRDFLHDALRAQSSGNPVTGIYGFKYDPKTNPNLCLKEMRMVVKNAEPKKKEADEVKELIKVAQNSLKLINHYEVIAGLKKLTNWAIVENKYIVFNGPQFWVKSPALTSMFTFLIRLGTKDLKFEDNESLKKALKEISTPTVVDKDNDRKYLTDTFDKLDIVARYANKILFTDKKIGDPLLKDKDIAINPFHNGGGILSLCTGKYVRKDAFAKLQEAIKVDATRIKKDKAKTTGKKKLIRIKGFGSPGIYDNYSPESVSFSWIAIDENGDRVQCHPTSGCREYTTGYLRSGLLGWKLPMSFCNTNVTGSPALDPEKFRLLVTVNGVDGGNGIGRVTKHKNALFFAKKILNFYENKHGIDLTKVSTVKVVYKEKELTSWLFTGSTEWMNSPVMFSIYTLIMRAAHEGDKHMGEVPDNITDEYVTEFWKRFRQKSTSANAKRMFDEGVRMDAILANRKKLFTTKPKTALKLDLSAKDSIFYGRAGFHSLFADSHFDKPLITRFKKLGI